MHGQRLLVATRKAEKVFKKYHGFSPRNERCVNACHFNYKGELVYEWTPRQVTRLVGFYRKTKVPCSCYMCGNPRKLGEIPIKELRAKEEFESEMLEISGRDATR